MSKAIFHGARATAAAILLDDQFTGREACTKTVLEFSLTKRGQIMVKRVLWFAMAPALLFATVATAQQHPMLDNVADRIVQKYQQSSCEQLWQERAAKQGRPKPQGEQNAIQMLQNDPQMRAEFINRVAAPIANKMFECGMIP